MPTVAAEKNNTTFLASIPPWVPCIDYFHTLFNHQLLTTLGMSATEEVMTVLLPPLLMKHLTLYH
jgi:hypothetical protein